MLIQTVMGLFFPPQNETFFRKWKKVSFGHPEISTKDDSPHGMAFYLAAVPMLLQRLLQAVNHAWMCAFNIGFTLALRTKEQDDKLCVGQSSHRSEWHIWAIWGTHVLTIVTAQEQAMQHTKTHSEHLLHLYTSNKAPSQAWIASHDKWRYRSWTMWR